jgi:hypothetical protein
MKSFLEAKAVAPGRAPLRLTHTVKLTAPKTSGLHARALPDDPLDKTGDQGQHEQQKRQIADNIGDSGVFASQRPRKGQRDHERSKQHNSNSSESEVVGH